MDKHEALTVSRVGPDTIDRLAMREAKRGLSLQRSLAPFSVYEQRY